MAIDRMREGMQEATIIEWKPKSPFGFGETDEGRVFLHISNFVQREKWPEVGDHVSFVTGLDPDGRPCARDIILLASGSVLGWRDLLELALLLGLPALALPALTDLLSPWWVLYCVTFTSLMAGMHLWFDKKFSIAERSRIPEATLHLFELMGGWPGSFLAQRLLRHKISKGRYQVVFWAIVLVHQLFALDLLFGGLLYNGLNSLTGGQ